MSDVIIVNFFTVSVLRDVVRVERRDAQANGNLQTTRCNHQTSLAFSLARGKYVLHSPFPLTGQSG